MNKAIFCDRDGTINALRKDQPYICDLKDVKLLENVKEGLLKFKEDGYLIVIITNQTGVGAGYYTQEQAEKINEKIESLLGFKFDGIYSCYDKPTENNKCRKPLPLMVEKACKDLNIDVRQSYFIGDKKNDIQTGINAKCKGTCLISLNYDYEFFNIKPDFIAKDILDFYNQLKKNK